MKRLSVFSVLIVSLFVAVGCANIKEQIDNVKTCAGDPACLDESVQGAKKDREIGRAVGDAIPIPAAPMVAGSAVYFLSLLIRLSKGGAKKKQQQVPA